MFLQGQSTCDVKAIKPHYSGVGAFCTAKGRVIASFRLLRAEQSFYVVMPADLTASLCKRLQMYVLRSRVVVEDLTPRRSMIGILGDGCESCLDACGLPIPQAPGAWMETPEFLAFRLNDDTHRILVSAKTEAAQQLGARLAANLMPAHPNIWHLKDIEAGFADIVAATSEEFLPQMLNLDQLGGISYQKGCYTGQEIVTRTHFLGQVKRRMFRGRCSADRMPEASDVLVETLGPEPKIVGQVVTAARESRESYQLLVVLAMDNAGSTNLRLGHADGPKAEILSRP